MVDKFLEVHACPACHKMPDVMKTPKSIEIYCCVLSSIEVEGFLSQSEIGFMRANGRSHEVNEILTKQAIYKWNSQVAEFLNDSEWGI